jgi:hypothetical protein
MSTLTPTLSQLLDDFINSKLLDVHVALPARIVSYDSKTQYASVQPEIKRKFKDGAVVNLPIINNVPVVMPRTSSSYVYLPIKQGDNVLLIFSERSIDIWKNKGGDTDPKDARHHALSDAFAIVGGYPLAKPIVGHDSKDLSLGNVLSKIQMTENGKFYIGNNLYNFVKLVDELGEQAKSLAIQASQITVNTIMGVSSLPNNTSIFVQIANEIQIILNKLKTLIKE